MSVRRERCWFTTPRGWRTSIGILESFTVERKTVLIRDDPDHEEILSLSIA